MNKPVWMQLTAKSFQRVRSRGWVTIDGVRHLLADWRWCPRDETVTVRLEVGNELAEN